MAWEVTLIRIMSFATILLVAWLTMRKEEAPIRKAIKEQAWKKKK